LFEIIFLDLNLLTLKVVVPVDLQSPLKKFTVN